MSMNLSIDTRKSMIDEIEAWIGPAPTLCFFTGAKPASCALADSGTKLATAILPTDWLTPATDVGGGVVQKSKNGTWQDPAADASGNVGYFRLYSSTDGLCKAQGSCTVAGGGGDMIVSQLAATLGNPITVTAFTLTAPNA
jgi:hypothetical protein